MILFSWTILILYDKVHPGAIRRYKQLGRTLARQQQVKSKEYENESKHNCIEKIKTNWGPYRRIETETIGLVNPRLKELEASKIKLKTIRPSHEDSGGSC